ncbi:hypothetical protein [Micromonospora cathayae]|uniref:Peptidase inhibitor family I36 n=1 Tax=Micromonospora cathayae TaxID=3028804 RepID=A0ABY7ZP06_9ACTN|nr:hypothetical protein [Micromonospora sp. HUAS 3]WDZ84161.1 hypothetical protein PVK37_27470 [Micromonospora sp. HUAS 3]
MRGRRIAAGAVLVVLGIGSAVSPAAADQRSAAAGPGQRPAAAGTDRHCVVDVSTAKMTCYTSFRTAIAVATAGRITDAPQDARAAAADPTLRRRLAAATPVKRDGVTAAATTIGTMYEDRDYDGGTLTYSAPSGCTGPTSDLDWQVELITPEHWNDEIGSFLAGGNCWLSLFEHRGWGGASTPFTWLDDYLGVLDDEASSIRWT